MAFENVFVVCCIVLCLWSPTFSMPTRCKMHGHLTQIHKQQLIDLGGNFPEQCKKENVAIAVPLDAYEITEDSEIEDIKMTIYEALNHVNIIFLSGQKPAAWNKTNLDIFHNILHRQIQGVKQCVQVGDGEPQGSHLVLKSYFEKLENVLKDKDYSFLCLGNCKKRSSKQFNPSSAAHGQSGNTLKSLKNVTALIDAAMCIC